MVTIPNVPLVSTGTFQLMGNPYGNETTFTEEDLQAMVAAQDDPAVAAPRLKLGHTSDWGDAEPAFGVVGNMRLGDNGQTLYGDYIGVPKWLADILPAVYPSRSVEANVKVETPTGRRYSMVMTAMALLGVQLPGVSTLEDLSGLYAETMPEGVEIQAETQIAASVGKEAVDREVEGQLPLEDVRRAFYDNLDSDQSWWWIRAVLLDPMEFIVDDDEGGLFRVPVDPSGEEPSFGDPVPVKVQYVNASGIKKHARSLDGAEAVYASRAESRPETERQEDGMDLKQIAAKLGLPEDATEEQILAAIPEQDPEETPPSTQAPGESEGNPADQGPESGTPSPEAGGEDEENDGEGEDPDTEAGTVTVDNETIAQLQRDAAAGREARAAQLKQERESFLKSAVEAGKFPPSRLEHWRKAYDADPAGTKSTIASLEDGLIPVEARGSGESVEGSLSNDAYPEEWLPEVAARKAEGPDVITHERS